ncbi:MAG: acetolactate synthase large subunit [Gemmatimonadota bacterium]|nr:acetolactate synthase large subunit [Gemmatimonadota bacterium]
MLPNHLGTQNSKLGSSYTGAQILINLLERQGIEIIPGMPGGANLPMYDALYDSSIRHVLARHEQGAGFMAQGMARVTGNPAVCFGTSGPGATNLITAIADARMDSIPLIAITGQVPRALIGTDAFQEVDTCGLTLPITKQNFLVHSAEELLDIIPAAFRIASSGRPGPVVVDVPKDVQTESVIVSQWPDPGQPTRPPSIEETRIDRMADMIRAAERPLFYIGGGIIAAEASTILRRLSERLSIPVTATLMGLGAMPTDHPLFLGMLGMHAARHTNMALEDCDLLIAAGVRFDDRATGKAAQFCPDAQIIHIDIDAGELGKIRQPHLCMEADVREVLDMLDDRLPDMTWPVWQARIAELRRQHPLVVEGKDDPLQPYGLILQTARLLKKDAIITTDVGQHQMWAAQVCPLRHPRQWLTSGGLGTMGFGMPAAIGAALANPTKPVVCISGDGSFLLNIQELATLAEENLNVKILVMNNAHLGMVRQQQELFYDGRKCASKFTRPPDLTAISRGFGVPAYDLDHFEAPLDLLKTVLNESGPCVINVPIAPEENVFPMVPPGAANREMIG